MFETNGLKAPYFQQVETLKPNAFNTRGQADAGVSLHLVFICLPRAQASDVLCKLLDAESDGDGVDGVAHGVLCDVPRSSVFR